MTTESPPPVLDRRRVAGEPPPSQSDPPDRFYCPAHCYAPGYRSRESLKAHLKAHHSHPHATGTDTPTRWYRPQERLVCPVSACGRRFATPRALVRHLDAQHGPPDARTTTLCKTCGWSGSPREVRAHVWREHAGAVGERIEPAKRLASALPPLPESALALLSAADAVSARSSSEHCRPLVPPVDPRNRERLRVRRQIQARYRDMQTGSAAVRKRKRDYYNFITLTNRVAVTHDGSPAAPARRPAASASCTTPPTTAPT